MIRLENVTKRFAKGAAPAVDDLSIEIPEGITVALVGPSGCGKTTTLRMINRLIEPSEGRIQVDGEDVLAVDPVRFRRRIGYVIQQVGLFPHMTIAQNIGAVPRLLGWTADKIRARNAELIDLVGLEHTMLERYPRQLSGGQRQRVGVARALAADPPVLLMDEPFGAIDPIALSRLQNEFRNILRRVKKTVVMVTHDVDEAIRLGDRIAIMRAGKVVQYDTPEAILSRPADPFVEDFVGADRALRRLSLFVAGERMGPVLPGPARASIARDADLRDALSAMIAAGTETLDVVDESGIRVGSLSRQAVFAA